MWEMWPGWYRRRWWPRPGAGHHPLELKGQTLRCCVPPSLIPPQCDSLQASQRWAWDTHTHAHPPTHVHILDLSTVNTSSEKLPYVLKELSSGLGDDSLLRLLLLPCELLQQLGSNHGVSLSTSCLPIRHDTHIVTAEKKKSSLASCILFTAFSLF